MNIFRPANKATSKASPTHDRPTMQESPELTEAYVSSILTKVSAADTMASKEAVGRDVILVVGNTGAGKSTFLNYLAGKTMTESRVPSSLEKGFTCENPIFQIGFGFVSQTDFPQVHYDPSSNMTYVDCPGFNDNRGVAFDISNMYAIARLAESAKSIKGVIVLINYHSLEADRARGMRECMDILRQIFGQSLDDNLHSVCVLVTRLPGHSSTSELVEFLNEGAFLPTAVASAAKCYHPLDRYPNTMATRQELLTTLKRFQGIDKPSINTALSNDSKVNLCKIVSYLKHKACAAFNDDDYAYVAMFHDLLERLDVLKVAELRTMQFDFTTFCMSEIRSFASEDANLPVLQNLKVELDWLKDDIDREIKVMVDRIEAKKAAQEKIDVAESDLQLARKELREKELAMQAAQETNKQQQEAIQRQIQELKEENKKLREEQQRATSSGGGLGGLESILPYLLSGAFGGGMGGMGGMMDGFAQMNIGRSSGPSRHRNGNGIVWVSGYPKANGTYVNPYPRRAPTRRR